MPGLVSIFFFLSGVVMITSLQASFPVSQISNSQGWERSIFQKYRTFVSVAHDYMRANPTFSGSAYWGTLSAKAPPSLLAVPMPADWKIIANGTSYVICTPMPSAAVAELGKHLESGPYALLKANTNKLVVGKPEDAVAAQLEADKCI